jgi:DNA helicase-2/ATP-dependent DNA helicase PcrA
MGIESIIAQAQGRDEATVRNIEAELLSGLNPEQLEAVLHEEGPALLVAVAGAGKTRVVVHRLARLVKVKGVNPGRVLAVTFSRKGADEMNDRLKQLIGDSDARVGTFHSVALEIHRNERLQCNGAWDWKIDDRDRYRVIIKEVVGYRQMNWKQADVTLIIDFIGHCKSGLLRPHSEECMAFANSYYQRAPSPRTNPRLLIECYSRCEDLRIERRLLTFDDFIFDVTEAFQQNESLRLRHASRFDWVMQDEAQDQNLGQILMGALLAKDHKNYVLVGDPAQCHPPGTMIEREAGVHVPIESLRDGDRIRGWNRKAQRMINGREVRVAERQYNGMLHKISVVGREVSMTSDHKVLARWTDRGVNDCVTYLMHRKDLGYRVGWCKLFAGRGEGVRNFHLATRAKLERADAVWILGVHKSRTDASVHEGVVSAAYGLPTSTFEPVNGAVHQTTEAIARIFGDERVASRNTESAHQCLLDHDMRADLPIWPFPKTQTDDPSAAYVRGTYFAVYARNVLPGLMSLPLPDEMNLWSPVESHERESYEGPVYSLDVERDHAYAANGVVVLNCIYTWRGARPEKLLSFEQDWGAKVITMGRNYRCGAMIIDTANRTLDTMAPETRLPVKMVCEKGNEGTISVRRYMTIEDEGVGVAEKIRDLVQDGGYQPRDVAVLYRTNAQSRAPEEGLISERIPYRILGGTSFYERREVKNLLAYLRLADGYGKFPEWMESMERCINTPFRFLGRAYVEHMSLVARKHAKEAKDSGEPFSWVAVVDDTNSQNRVNSKQRASSEDWAAMIERLREIIRRSRDENATEADKTQAMPAKLLNDIVSETGYTDFLRRDEGEESTENNRVSNVREMVRAAGRFPSVRELLDYVAKTIKASRKSKREKDPNKVTLCSIHRSKGLEWPIVFVVGVAFNILPHGRAEDPEEEKRLFYVATTRAKDELHYSFPSAMAVGNRVVDMTASPFLTAINADNTMPSFSQWEID